MWSNTSVPEICGLIDSEYEVAQAREEMGLEAQLADAGVDPAEGFVLPWEESSGWRRRLQAHSGSSGGGSSGGGSRQRRRLHGSAGPHQQQAAAEQPAAPRGPQQQHQGRRLLGGDMGDRVTDPLNVLVAARGNHSYPTEVRPPCASKPAAVHAAGNARCAPCEAPVGTMHSPASHSCA